MYFEDSLSSTGALSQRPLVQEVNGTGVEPSLVSSTRQLRSARHAEAQLKPKGGDGGLFCLCQQPYNGEFMVLCGSCREWYHPDCVGITKAECTQSKEFICRTCKKLEDIMRARKGGPALEPVVDPKNGKGPTNGDMVVKLERKDARDRGNTKKEPSALDLDLLTSLQLPPTAQLLGSTDQPISPSADPIPILEAAVAHLLLSGATTLRQLSVLEKSPAIPWDRLPHKGRHWKRDIIRAVYLKVRPKPPPPPTAAAPAAAAADPPPTPPVLEAVAEQDVPPFVSDVPPCCIDVKDEDDPPAKKARAIPPKSEVERLGGCQPQLSCHTKATRLARQLSRRTRPTTQSARFKGEFRKTQSEDEEEEEVEGSLHCACRKTWDGSFMVRCDGCRIWYHPRCIGLTRVDCDHPGHFYCPKCTRWK
eukprot:EG_transcript_9488